MHGITKHKCTREDTTEIMHRRLGKDIGDKLSTGDYWTRHRRPGRHICVILEYLKIKNLKTE